VILPLSISQSATKCDYVSIDELNACQIENQLFTLVFHDPFRFRQFLGLNATTQSERHEIAML
jgi:hypothetical protein